MFLGWGKCKTYVDKTARLIIIKKPRSYEIGAATLQYAKGIDSKNLERKNIAIGINYSQIKISRIVACL